jgi:hypothetical protein
MLHYAKTFEEGIISQFFQISTLLSRKHLWTFASSRIGLKQFYNFKKPNIFKSKF